MIKEYAQIVCLACVAWKVDFAQFKPAWPNQFRTGLSVVLKELTSQIVLLTHFCIWTIALCTSIIVSGLLLSVYVTQTIGGDTFLLMLVMIPFANLNRVYTF